MPAAPRSRRTAASTSTPVNAHWQRELGRAISNVGDLLAAVGLHNHQLGAGWTGRHANVLAKFPVRVTRAYVDRIRHADPLDPLLRQVLPVLQEDDEVAGYVDDPVGDLDSMVSRGLLQKYHGRALLIVTGACAIHCRYCFRRNYPYHDSAMTPRYLDTAIATLAADTSIKEVILSGGDPLSLTNNKLRTILARLGELPQVTRIRLHTRLPVVLPERVDQGLLELLAAVRQQLIWVMHTNHAQEIDSHVASAFSRLGANGAILLNQSVLLRGVNDSSDSLIKLSERLFESAVMPYYLHQLDRVTGAAHFPVDDNTARRLIQEISVQLPGYLVPKLVRETAGAHAKLPL